MRKVFLFFTFLMFISCNDSAYYQYFSNYSEFLKIKNNKRVSEKFPNIIKSDAFHLKSCSYIGKSFFSKFKYTKNENYDSIFQSNQKITFFEFNKKLNKVKNLYPDWNINYKYKDSLKYEIIKNKCFYILRDKKKKEIFSFTSL